MSRLAETLAAPIRLSVAAPAYNEADGIEAVLQNWHDYLAGCADVAQFEIVVCNDGSRDKTGDILDRLTLPIPQLKPVHFATNQGAAAALTAAIAATSGDWVLLIDSDGQFPISALPGMLKALRACGSRAAIGIRHKNDGVFARFGSWASGAICNLVHGSRVSDFNSAFKLVWGPTLRGLRLEARGMNYSTEVTSRLLECGIIPAEIAITHQPRTAGASSMKLAHGAAHRFLFVIYIAIAAAVAANGGPDPAATMNRPVKIVLFCGGRGSATIIRALLRHDNLKLTLLVNAFDDGLSTGALRSFIPGMLGPSDFRKNLSYLRGNYSGAQYALRNLMEYRLPASSASSLAEGLARFSRTGQVGVLDEPLKDWFAQLPRPAAMQIQKLLAQFFAHAEESGSQFIYADCSLGNLVFAGAYLNCGRDFNAAAAMIGALVGSRAQLLNVGEGENRHLLALQEDGNILASEAQIVSPQSAFPIAQIYLLEFPLTDLEKAALSGMDMAAKQSFLAARDRVPAICAQACDALAQADIILYGPGTQHSSLFPSYRIAAKALAAAPAPVKALVVNLEADHDIQGFTAAELVHRAIDQGAAVSDILLNQDELPGRLASGATDYKALRVWPGVYANTARPSVHNGEAIANRLLSLLTHPDLPPSIEVFSDMHNRSLASDDLVEEFLEAGWEGDAHLILNRLTQELPDAPVTTVMLDGPFPEIACFRDWLVKGTSDYLVLLTGDGAYSFRDVQAILRLLERQPMLGGVFGSRTQSRRQFIASIQSAYGERRLLYFLGKTAAFFLSLVFYLRTGIIFSDPLTGLRVFRRQAVRDIPGIDASRTPLALVRRLVKGGVEVAEIPVVYRTFSGFTDPGWRIRRGLANLWSLL